MDRATALAAHHAAPFEAAGVVGTYTPVSGTAYAVPVVPRYGAQRVDAQGFLVRRDLIHVLRADLLAEPAQGDRLTIDGVVHEVDAWEEAGNGARRVLTVRRLYAP
jgi:hypothetical protein